MKTLAAFATIPLAAISISTAFAASSAPIDNLQPSLALNPLLLTNGLFPFPGSGQAEGGTLGFLYDFAGNFAPRNSLAAQGQLLSISSNVALYSLLGNTYGGDFHTTFNLPNLQGAAIVGVGAGAGLTPRPLGSVAGSPSVTLTPTEVPTGLETAAPAPYNTVQPSLALEPLIAVNAPYPASGSGDGSAAFLGQIAYFAGNIVPAGWALANGQLLSLAANPALFSVIGTTYGGNGISNFALPDLQGRIAIGADAAIPLGQKKGAETVTVTRADLPGPGEEPVSNDQPSLAVNYLIAISGLFPSTSSGSFDASTATIGEVVPYAGTRVPAGWMFANGQTLPINEYQALFSLIGNTYGGNGFSTFALPDLDGRTVIGDSSVYPEGDAVGADSFLLTAAELPAVTLSVPEPSTWTMLALGFAAMGFALRRTRVSALARA